VRCDAAFLMRIVTADVGPATTTEQSKKFEQALSPTVPLMTISSQWWGGWQVAAMNVR
jgi:hypothetical protein